MATPTFEDIYKTHWQKVYRLCMGYVNDRDWAKDIAQEVFITVWQQLPKFRGESAVGTWVFRIASNQCLRQLEKQNRIPKGQLPVEIADMPSQSIEKRMELLYLGISQLAEMERIIISLELEDVRQAEIANIVGISEANVRVKIHRIKEKLTKMMKSHE
jgi:RNA polymerase sigma-70 factor (ECF subfamily)